MPSASAFWFHHSLLSKGTDLPVGRNDTPIFTNLMTQEKNRKLIILDRDGVINEDSPNYIKSVDEWHPITGSCEAIQKLNKAGYIVAVASNQSGIGRGLYDEHTYKDIERKMQQTVSQSGGKIDYISYCPHTPEDKCLCRKPQPGMLIEIARHYDLPCRECVFVGDSMRDIQAARNAGCQPALVLTGNGWKTRDDPSNNLDGVNIYADLASFAIDQIYKA